MNRIIASSLLALALALGSGSALAREAPVPETALPVAEPKDAATPAPEAEADAPESDAAKAKPPDAPTPTTQMPGNPMAKGAGRPNMPSGDTAVFNFIAPITSETMAQLVQHAQNSAARGAKAIRIHISSPGGDVRAAQFATNALAALPVRLETVALASVASAAVALYCIGERRYVGTGASFYLHQQTRYSELSVKTASALAKEHEIVQSWYDDILEACLSEEADRDRIDYSARDVVLADDEARQLGMVTDEFEDLRKVEMFGIAVNILHKDSPGMYPGMYPRR